MISKENERGHTGPVGDPTDSESVPVDPDAEGEGSQEATLATSAPPTLRKLLAAKKLRQDVVRETKKDATAAGHSVSEASKAATASTQTAIRGAGRKIRDAAKTITARLGAVFDAWRSKRDDVE